MNLPVFFIFIFSSLFAFSQQDSTILTRKTGETDIQLNERAAKILDERGYSTNGPVKGKTGISDNFIVTAYNSSAIVLLHLDSATGNRFKAYRIDFRHDEQYIESVTAIFYANADKDPEKEFGFILRARLVAHDDEGNRIFNDDYFTEFYEFKNGEVNYLEEISNKLEGLSTVSEIRKQLKVLGY